VRAPRRPIDATALIELALPQLARVSGTLSIDAGLAAALASLTRVGGSTVIDSTSAATHTLAVAPSRDGHGPCPCDGQLTEPSNGHATHIRRRSAVACEEVRSEYL